MTKKIIWLEFYSQWILALCTQTGGFQMLRSILRNLLLQVYTPKELSKEEYQEFLELTTKSSPKKYIRNGDVRHTQTIVNFIFSNAEESIFMFSNELDPLIFEDEDIFHNIEKALDSGVKLNLCLENSDTDSTKIQKLLRHKYATVYKVKEKNKNGLHFCIYDYHGFRSQIEKGDPYKAVFCANDKKKSKILYNRFDKIEKMKISL